MLFQVSPKNDFGKFKAGVSYSVLAIGKNNNSEPTLMVADDDNEIFMLACDKFKYVPEVYTYPSTSTSEETGVSPTPKNKGGRPKKRPA